MMVRNLQKLLFLFVFCSFPLLAQAYSYGPACQWIRLIGSVELPAGQSLNQPIELSVTYQLPDQKAPATLLTNYPLQQKKFVFVLAGFREEIEGVIFVSPMFFFAKEIIFRYYAKSADGKWKSEFYESRFNPPNIPRLDIPANRGKDYRCHTAIELKPLVLQPTSFRTGRR